MNTQTQTPPAAIPPQHVIALEKAQRIRLTQAAIRRRVTAGDLPVDAILIRDVDLTLLEQEAVDRLPVRALLLMVRRVGQARVASILRRVAIPEMKPVGRMTDRQRHALAGVCREVLGGSDA
jgi:hypothetical protein